MTTWHIDQAHSDIGFSVKHLLISTVRGRFTTFEGTLTATDETFSDAQLKFSTDVASITTNNAMRDGHLQAPDFFDAANNPKIMFVSKSFAKTGDKTFKVTGDFTMRGVTKEVTLDAVLNGFAANAQGKRMASFDVSGTIKRTDYGVSWNAAIETGGLAVSEDVTLEATVELVQE